MTSWELVDVFAPITDPGISDEDYPRIPVEHETQLRHELLHLAGERPRIIFLTHSSGNSLMIGIGGPFAAVQYSRSNGSAKVAVANEIRAKGPIEFQFEGSQSGYWPKNLISLEDAVEIVVHFFRTQELAGWIKWD
jgi:Immunity protein Imm1